MKTNDKRVLVTGADGFIGSHLVERFCHYGYQVRAFVYYNSFNSWGWLDSLPDDTIKNIEVVTGDVRDEHNIRNAMKETNIVCHLAALIGIPYSYNSPASYVDTNIKGTLNVLQAARDNEVERVIVTSTSEVYGTAQYVPIDESHPLQAQSPYSATKIAADKLSESFYRVYGTPVVIARPFNTYGPRQSVRAIIPTIISQIMSGSDDIHLGNVSPRRDLNYVTDVCEAFVALSKGDNLIGEEVNICSGNDISIGELVERISSIMGKSVSIKCDDVRVRPDKSEVERLLGCNKKIGKLAGWRPKVILDDGLKMTIEWFSKNNASINRRPHHYSI